MDIAIIKEHIEGSVHHLVISIHKEELNTKEAGEVIRKYIETGQISEDDEKLLKLQLEDTLKIAGIVVPFVLIPGASIVMPILIKVAEKHNINLLPSTF